MSKFDYDPDLNPFPDSEEWIARPTYVEITIYCISIILMLIGAFDVIVWLLELL